MKMEISIIDSSKYFKGLLLLIKKDRKLSDLEFELMMRIGKSLGFEREFCETTIKQILHNKHITEEVPVFSTSELAKKFIRDGLAIALSDVEVHPDEEAWLRTIADGNGLSPEWYEKEFLIATKRNQLPEQFEVEGLKVKHY